MLRKIFTIIGLGFLIVFCIICYNNDYMTFKRRDCIVLNKMESQGKHHSNYILVVKEERGLVFDIIVSPSTYWQAKVGNHIRFNLRQMDILQTQKENVFYFFGPLITIFLGLIFLLLSRI